MISTQLVSYFMHYIIYIEIIALRNSVSRGGDATAFRTIHTNATDATRIAAATRSSKHVAYIIICFADHVGERDRVRTAKPSCELQRRLHLRAIGEDFAVGEADVLDPDRRPVEADRVAAHDRQAHELHDRPVAAHHEVRAHAGQLVEQASFPGRLLSVDELEERARSAGLRISRLWGDYDLRPWDRGSSQRLIAEMRRS